MSTNTAKKVLNMGIKRNIDGDPDCILNLRRYFDDLSLAKFIIREI